MAFQSRRTRKQLAQGVLHDGRTCKVCGCRSRSIGRSPLQVCNQPRCLARYAEKYGVD